MNVVRTELKLAKTDKRFPKKGTCMAIYSRCVNSQDKLDLGAWSNISPGARNGATS